MLQAAGPSLTLVELGAGTATKTCILIEELLQRQPRALFYPIDVSPSALQEAAKQLGQQFPQLRVNPIVADYTGGVEALNRISGRKLVLYIGSSIGNFEPDHSVGILRRIRRSLRAGDALLLGADFAKSPKVLLPAYDDAQGVTAAFNKNILARLNRELDADFDLDAFRHVALWNKHCSRMEMHLESLGAQQVFLPMLDMDVTFAAGERIHTENSYKYTHGDDRNDSAGERLQAGAELARPPEMVWGAPGASVGPSCSESVSVQPAERFSLPLATSAIQIHGIAVPDCTVGTPSCWKRETSGRPLKSPNPTIHSRSPLPG